MSKPFCSFYQIHDLKEILSHQEIFAGMYSSPYGNSYLQTTKDYLLGLYFPESDKERYTIEEKFIKKYALTSFKQNDNLIVHWGQRIFAMSEKFIPFKIGGTDFQLSVWQHLASISEGNTISYEEIARTLNKPRAMRAVGNAIGANPVSFVLPCHRVLRKGGNLGGYRWGSLRKQQILAAESLNT